MAPGWPSWDRRNWVPSPTPGRDVDFELALPAQVAFALALLARTADDLAAPAALGAGAAHGEKRLLVDHLAASAAGGAGDQTVVRLGTLALAAAAFFQARYLDVGGQAAQRVLEADLQIVADVLAALRPTAALAREPPNTSPNPNTSLRMSPRSGKPAPSKPPSLGRAGDALVAETVVRRALLRIGKDAIGLRGFLELLLGLRDCRGCGRDGAAARACGKLP